MSSSDEIEIKFKIADVQSLAAKLHKAGFRQITPRTREMNTLFDLPGHPLGVKDWSEWLALPNPNELDGKIRKCTRSGWPCGDQTFVEHLENIYGRPLRPQKPGPK